MGFIYNEDFVSPQDDRFRFGGFEGSNSGVWLEDYLPYTEVHEGSLQKYTQNIDDAREYESGKIIDAGYIESFFEDSKIVTYGCWIYGVDRGIEISFHHCHPGGSSKHENFRVKFSMDGIKQKAEVDFVTAQGEDHEDEYPLIPSETVYFDFTQPVWVWVQCNMQQLYHGGLPSGPYGDCKIWLNDQLYVEKHDIHSGDELGWRDDWDAEYNNVVQVNFNGSPNCTLGLIALNDYMNYLVDALGNIDIATLPPSSGTENFGPGFQGEPLPNKDASTVLEENRFIDLSRIDEFEYVRGRDPSVRDMYSHGDPFVDHIHNIRAVSQQITHMKRSFTNHESTVRIEPSYALSGRYPESDREYGQVSANATARVIQKYHTIPYVYDAHDEIVPWSLDFFRNSMWGYQYVWPVFAEKIEDSFGIQDLAFRYFDKETHDGVKFEDFAEILFLPNEAFAHDKAGFKEEASTEVIWAQTLDRWKVELPELTTPAYDTHAIVYNHEGYPIDWAPTDWTDIAEDEWGFEDHAKLQLNNPDEEIATEEMQLADDTRYEYTPGLRQYATFSVPDVQITTSFA